MSLVEAYRPLVSMSCLEPDSVRSHSPRLLFHKRNRRMSDALSCPWLADVQLIEQRESSSEFDTERQR